MRFRSVLLVAAVSAASCGRTQADRSMPPVRQTASYRLLEQVAVETLAPPVRPMVFVIGETHLGPSQIAVARVMADLFAKEEIDAVLLEQPDMLSFDWQKYKEIQGDPDRTIAAVQQRTIDDASRKVDYDVGRLQVAWDAYLRHRDTSRLTRDLQRYGSGAVDELQQQMEAQNHEIEATMGVYNKSEYVSASDNLFVMLRAKGIGTPFWNIESKELRDAFAIPEDATPASIAQALVPRDKYMSDKLADLAQTHGYKRIVLVCGALHLTGLPQRIRARGYDVKVVYDAMEAKAIKQDMAVLVRPDVIIDAVRRGARPDFTLSTEFLVNGRPSRQLVSRLNEFMTRLPAGFLAPGDAERVRMRFGDAYERQSGRNQAAWSFEVTLGTGGLLRISRDSDGATHFAGLSPLSVPADADLSTYVPSRPVTLIVADLGTHFRVLRGSGGATVFSGLSIPDLVQAVNRDLRNDSSRTVYLDVSGMAPERREAFTSSVRGQGNRPDRQVQVRTYFRPSTTPSRADTDLLFATDARIELRSTALEQMTVGQYRGWFVATCELVGAAGRLTVQIIAKSADIARQALSLLREISGRQDFIGLSPAAVLDEMRWEMKRRHKLTDDELLLKFTDEFGNSQIVKLHIERADAA